MGTADGDETGCKNTSDLIRFLNGDVEVLGLYSQQRKTMNTIGLKGS